MDKDKLSEDQFNDDLSDIPSDCESIGDEHIESDIIPRKKRFRRISPESDSEIDEDERSDSELQITWNDTDTLPQLEPFEGVPGMTINPKNSENIIDPVELLFTNDFFAYLCQETNRYHDEQGPKYKTFSHGLKWFNVTPTEMKKFLGIIVLMGFVKKSKIRDYWSKDPLIETPMFAKIMSRARFEQILKFWHFNNNTQLPAGSNRLIKVQPLLDHFLPKFQKLYMPERDISLDESVIPWSGRLLFRTYNPSKMIKYGLLVRALCESKTGYVINIELYSGEAKKLQDTMFAVLQPVLGKWHRLYQDNYCNSAQNAALLLQKKIRVCGAIRENGRLPKDSKTDTVPTGKQNRKRKRNVVKTLCITEYSKFMKGVNRRNQYLSYYSVLGITKKWTKRTALYLINIALFNSFIMYQAMNSTKKMQYKNYLLSVARAWVTATPGIDEMQPTTSQATGPTVEPAIRLSGDMTKHVLVILTSTKSQKYPKKLCFMCKMYGIRRETRYICKCCEVPLHKEGNCFNYYHTSKEL